MDSQTTRKSDTSNVFPKLMLVDQCPGVSAPGGKRLGGSFGAIGRTKVLNDYTAALVVAVITHARARRIRGALAGGFAVGVAALGIVALGEKARWWHEGIK